MDPSYVIVGCGEEELDWNATCKNISQLKRQHRGLMHSTVAHAVPKQSLINQYMQPGIGAKKARKPARNSHKKSKLKKRHLKVSTLSLKNRRRVNRASGFQVHNISQNEVPAATAVGWASACALPPWCTDSNTVYLQQMGTFIGHLFSGLTCPGSKGYFHCQKPPCCCSAHCRTISQAVQTDVLFPSPTEQALSHCLEARESSTLSVPVGVQGPDLVNKDISNTQTSPSHFNKPLDSSLNPIALKSSESSEPTSRMTEKLSSDLKKKMLSLISCPEVPNGVGTSQVAPSKTVPDSSSGCSLADVSPPLSISGNIDKVEEDFSPLSLLGNEQTDTVHEQGLCTRASNTDAVPSKEDLSRETIEIKQTQSSEKVVEKDSLYEDLGMDFPEFLLLLRQQELFHQARSGEPVSSSSDQRLLFRKRAVTNQLPPELQNCRIMSSNVTKKVESALDSALDIIEDNHPMLMNQPDDNTTIFDTPVESLYPAQRCKKTKLSLRKNNDCQKIVTLKRCNSGTFKNCVVAGGVDLKHRYATVNEGTLMMDGCLKQTNHSEPSHPTSREISQEPLKQDEKLSSVKLSAACKDNDTYSQANSDDLFGEEWEGDEIKVIKTPDAPVRLSESCNITEVKSELKGIDHLEKPITMDAKGVERKGKQKLSLRSASITTEGFYKSLKSDKLKEHAQKESSLKERDDKECMPPPHGRTLSLTAAQGQKFSAGTVLEVAEAHDLAVAAILNPWRGIVARQTAKGFVAPEYDRKKIVQALWDLRSDVPPENVVKKIMSVNWTSVNKETLEIMVSRFIFALARSAPFVMEAKVLQEHDESSVSSQSSEKDEGKKTSSLRLVASRPILKGELIDGLCGILLFVTSEERKLLGSWNSLKFEQKECSSYSVFGPLAYLLKGQKKKHPSINSEAIFINEHEIGAKAARNINKGERILLSFKSLERSLFKR